MQHYDIQPQGSSLKESWGWALGSIIGSIYYLNTYTMSLLEINLDLLWQYGKLLFFAFSGGFLGNLGKWAAESIRQRKEKKARKTEL